MQKPRIIFAFLTLSFAALCSPFFVNLIVGLLTCRINITGAPFGNNDAASVVAGVIIGLWWLLMLVLVFIQCIKQVRRLNKKYTLLSFVCFVLLFLVAASCMGWDAFLYVFTYHEPKRVTMYRPACLMLQSLFKIFAF